MFIPRQVLLASDWGALLGDSCGLILGLCRQGIRVKRGCDRKDLAGSQAMTGKAYRPGLGRLAWPVTATSELDDIFAGAKIYSVLGVDGRLHCQRFFISIISTINNLTHYP